MTNGPPFAPIYRDFILGNDSIAGTDDWDFRELSLAERGFYLQCWALLWTSPGNIQAISTKRAKIIAYDLKIDGRTSVNILDKLCNTPLVDKDGDSYIFNNINKLKRKLMKKSKDEFDKSSGSEREKVGDSSERIEVNQIPIEVKPKETKKETKPKDNPGTPTPKDSDFPNGEKPLASGNCPMAKETLSNVIRNHWPNAEDLVFALNPLGLNQDVLMAYFLDAKKADNPQGWLVKVLYNGKYNPTKTAIKEIDKIAKKLGDR